MKTRITLLAENDAPISALGDNPEEKVKAACELVLAILRTEFDNDDTAIIEKVEVFE